MVEPISSRPTAPTDAQYQDTRETAQILHQDLKDFVDILQKTQQGNPIDLLQTSDIVLRLNEDSKKAVNSK